MIINLKQLYPHLCADIYCEVSAMVADTIYKSIRENHAYNERRRVHHAYYSLSTLPESELTFLVLSPEEIYEQECTNKNLYAALQQLPPKQASRIYAHYFLGLTITDISRLEKVNRATVSRSIYHGLQNLKKFLADTATNK